MNSRFLWNSHKNKTTKLIVDIYQLSSCRDWCSNVFFKKSWFAKVLHKLATMRFYWDTFEHQSQQLLSKSQPLNCIQQKPFLTVYSFGSNILDNKTYSLVHSLANTFNSVGVNTTKWTIIRNLMKFLEETHNGVAFLKNRHAFEMCIVYKCKKRKHLKVAVRVCVLPSQHRC